MEQAHSNSVDYRDIRLTDGVITLRKLRDEDMDALFAGQQDEEHKKWQGGEEGTLDDTLHWIRKSSGRIEWLNGHYVFAIEDNESGELAGVLDLSADTYPNEECKIQVGEANIAYSVFRDFRNRGFATAAVNLALPFLQSQGVERALIRVNPENKPSIRVAEKCGFARTGKQWRTGNKELLDEFEKRLDE